MKKVFSLFLTIVIISSCQIKEKQPHVQFKKYDETLALEKQKEHPKKRMQFKLFQSKVLDMNQVFKPFNNDLAYFSEEDYQSLKHLVLEQNIPSIQKSIQDGRLTYEKLTLFYLYRIRKFESDSTKSLNAIISLNPNVIKEAREKDKNRSKYLDKTNLESSVYGMPILLKDNINTQELPTTAGAIAFQRNYTKNDAFIVEKLRGNGALILGKVNLSEWAYYFCSGCPLGYSAIGGQTLNPYGRAEFETGGSSSGSGVAVAANYAVAAIGTETSGSITSPSSLNSVVGLKPTIGVLSRTGIVPISSTLDTPGPMTKSVTDNYILLNALLGFDKKDRKSKRLAEDFLQDFSLKELKDKRVGYLKYLLTDSIYKSTIDKLKKSDLELVEITPPQIAFQGFRTLLNIDMRHDLPKYISSQADKSIYIKGVKSVVDFNEKDSVIRAPYGQQLFKGILKDSTTLEQLKVIKSNLMIEGRKYLQALETENLDAILSINNYHSGVSAVAEYPTLTVPMGYKESGEPISLTFIGLPLSELKLYELAFGFEQLTKVRLTPEKYK